MHLLHCKVGEGTSPPILSLEEFLGKVPPYAILSHRWGSVAEEVSYHDFTANTVLAKQRKGFRKIEAFCNLALKEGLVYSWVDTCCINKQSSAELSEAINSMYKWYECAEMCYAFLDDVDSALADDGLNLAFRASRWFTRGWTLQELIAPSILRFFDCNWAYIGDKLTLAGLVGEITKVSEDILIGRCDLTDASVAQKMSWASKRETTRPEDEAYALMGLFGVNMPIIYGEGSRAFLRLQEEIMRITGDHSIFAWEAVDEDCEYFGMLASSPSQFLNSAGYQATDYWNFVARHLPGTTYSIASDASTASTAHLKADYTVTNHGLHIQLPLANMSAHFHRMYFAFLACTHGEHKESTIIFLRQRLGIAQGHFIRTKFSGQSLYHQPYSVSMRAAFKLVYVCRNDSLPRAAELVKMLRPPRQYLKLPSEIQATLRQYAGTTVFKFSQGYPPQLVTIYGLKATLRLVNGSHICITLRSELYRNEVFLVCGVQDHRLWYNIYSKTRSSSTVETEHSKYDIFASAGGQWQYEAQNIHFLGEQATSKDATTTRISEPEADLSFSCEGSIENGCVSKLSVTVTREHRGLGPRIAQSLGRMIQ